MAAVAKSSPKRKSRKKTGFIGKAAAIAKTNPQWKSRRGTKLGRQGGSVKFATYPQFSTSATLSLRSKPSHKTFTYPGHEKRTAAGPEANHHAGKGHVAWQKPSYRVAPTPYHACLACLVVPPKTGLLSCFHSKSAQDVFAKPAPHGNLHKPHLWATSPENPVACATHLNNPSCSTSFVGRLYRTKASSANEVSIQKQAFSWDRSLQRSSKSSRKWFLFWGAKKARHSQTKPKFVYSSPCARACAHVCVCVRRRPANVAQSQPAAKTVSSGLSVTFATLVKVSWQGLLWKLP